jgi:two-component system, NtrC family, sensor histidine kinase HydH
MTSSLPESVDQVPIRRLAFLVTVVAFVTVGHYTIGLHQAAWHDVFRRLYYVPIIFGASWFGLRGGLVTAGIVAGLFVPHVLLQWREMPLEQPEQYLEILIYLVVAGVTGALSEKEASRRKELRLANEKVEEGYQRLREQSVALVRADEQLRRADRLAALGELSASMAHEIRNPLGSIKGTAEIFRDSLPAGHRLAEFARILVKEADRLDRILTHFLGFARPKDVVSSRTELAPAVAQVVGLTRERARSAGVAITVELSPEVPPVAIPSDALGQVLLNLVLNAIQALGPGGRVSISGAIAPARRLACRESPVQLQVVHLAVADDGPGIPHDIRERVFDPFFTTRRGGTGLGLAICQRIVLGYRGAIAVVAAAPQGARFEMELPVADGGSGA